MASTSGGQGRKRKGSDRPFGDRPSGPDPVGYRAGPSQPKQPARAPAIEFPEPIADEKRKNFSANMIVRAVREDELTLWAPGEPNRKSFRSALRLHNQAAKFGLVRVCCGKERREATELPAGVDPQEWQRYFLPGDIICVTFSLVQGYNHSKVTVEELKYSWKFSRLAASLTAGDSIPRVHNKVAISARVERPRRKLKKKGGGASADGQTLDEVLRPDYTLTLAGLQSGPYAAFKGQIEPRGAWVPTGMFGLATLGMPGEDWERRSGVPATHGRSISVSTFAPMTFERARELCWPDPNFLRDRSLKEAQQVAATAVEMLAALQNSVNIREIFKAQYERLAVDVFRWSTSKPPYSVDLIVPNLSPASTELFDNDQRMRLEMAQTLLLEVGQQLAVGLPSPEQERNAAMLVLYPNHPSRQAWLADTAEIGTVLPTLITATRVDNTFAATVVTCAFEDRHYSIVATRNPNSVTIESRINRRLIRTQQLVFASKFITGALVPSGSGLPSPAVPWLGAEQIVDAATEEEAYYSVSESDGGATDEEDAATVAEPTDEATVADPTDEATAADPTDESDGGEADEAAGAEAAEAAGGEAMEGAAGDDAPPLPREYETSEDAPPPPELPYQPEAAAWLACMRGGLRRVVRIILGLEPSLARAALDRTRLTLSQYTAAASNRFRTALRDRDRNEIEPTAAQLCAMQNALVYDYPVSVIHGPPGTGKSQTIINLVLQAFNVAADTTDQEKELARLDYGMGVWNGDRLLLIAPANAACDNLTVSFHDQFERYDLALTRDPEAPFKIVRLYARAVREASEKLENYTPDPRVAAFEMFDSDDTPTIDGDLDDAVANDMGYLTTDEAARYGDKPEDERPHGFRYSYAGAKAALVQAKKDFDELAVNGLMAVKGGKKRSEELAKEMARLKDSLSITFLEIYKPHVVICTPAAALQVVFSKYKPTRIIIDEAAFTATIGILQALSVAHGTLKSLVLVGDHKQLAAPSNLTGDALRLYRYGIFERLVNIEGYYENGLHGKQLGEPLCPYLPVVQLTDCYRLKEGGMMIHLRTNYTQGLRAAPSIATRMESDWMRNSILWPARETGRTLSDTTDNALVLFDNLTEARDAKCGKSRTSQVELRAVLHYYYYFIGQTGFTVGEMVVLCFYKAQVHLIRRAFALLAADHRPEVATVDGYQGKEKELVILCTTRAATEEDVKKRREQLLKSKLAPEVLKLVLEQLVAGFSGDPHRVTVATSRHIHAFIMLGHFPTLSHSETYTPLIEFAKTRNYMREDRYKKTVTVLSGSPQEADRTRAAYISGQADYIMGQLKDEAFTAPRVAAQLARSHVLPVRSAAQTIGQSTVYMADFEAFEFDREDYDGARAASEALRNYHAQVTDDAFIYQEENEDFAAESTAAEDAHLQRLQKLRDGRRLKRAEVGLAKFHNREPPDAPGAAAALESDGDEEIEEEEDDDSAVLASTSTASGAPSDPTLALVPGLLTADGPAAADGTVTLGQGNYVIGSRDYVNPAYIDATADQNLRQLRSMSLTDEAKRSAEARRKRQETSRRQRELEHRQFIALREGVALHGQQMFFNWVVHAYRHMQNDTSKRDTYAVQCTSCQAFGHFSSECPKSKDTIGYLSWKVGLIDSDYVNMQMCRTCRIFGHTALSPACPKVDKEQMKIPEHIQQRKAADVVRARVAQIHGAHWADPPDGPNRPAGALWVAPHESMRPADLTAAELKVPVTHEQLRARLDYLTGRKNRTTP